MTDRPLTVLFLPESAYGPTGSCIGIGDVLLRRGRRVGFAAEASWTGKLEQLGFVEDLVHLAPPPEGQAHGATAALLGPVRPRAADARAMAASIRGRLGKQRAADIIERVGVAHRAGG